MSKAKVKNQAQAETYHAENFKLNKAKVLRPPYLTYALLIIYSLYILLPLYIIVITSFKRTSEAAGGIDGFFTWWPQMGFNFEAYKEIFDKGVIPRSLANTFAYYLPTSVLNIFFSAVSAYGFAKMEWTGRSAIFGFLIITMTLPGSITQTSSRVWMTTLGMDGTPLPLILPGIFGGIGQVFFLKQYIAGIPDDLIGAAKIDGMGQVKIFLTLIIPLTLPALLVRIVLAFIGGYNDYMGPLIYMTGEEDMYTLQLALKNIADQAVGRNEYKMAAATIGMFPLIVVYIFIQDYIIKSTSIGSGLKG